MVGVPIVVRVTQFEKSSYRINMMMMMMMMMMTIIPTGICG